MVGVLLLSTYELGHQPINLARPAAVLRSAGHEVRCVDLAVEPLDEASVQWADLVGLSVPMHTATRLATRLTTRLRALNPAAHLACYGLYASLNAEYLLDRHVDSVIGGEFEQPLLQLADRLARRGGPADEPLVGLRVRDGAPVPPFLGRLDFARPDRRGLPPLDRYARLDDGRARKLVGYVEASRGCAHRCLHCPIPPVYGGRLRIVQRDAVLDDVRQLVRMGAQHITFGDPDFFNGVKHSLALVDAMHAELPWLTYDATIKVEHLLEHRALLPRLRETGCLFVVSAVEAVDDVVLGHLRKGHTRADVELALTLMREAGIALRPTFLPFTPWLTLEGYLNLLDFLARHQLVAAVDPIQLAVRLLVPPGSGLLGTPALAPHLRGFDEESLSYRWAHPDPRMDALQKHVGAIAEEAARSPRAAAGAFAEIRAAALAAVQGEARSPVADLPAEPIAVGAVPHLTEPWFC